jgi:hypothetical protein
VTPFALDKCQFKPHLTIEPTWEQVPELTGKQQPDFIETASVRVVRRPTDMFARRSPREKAGKTMPRSAFFVVKPSHRLKGLHG